MVTWKIDDVFVNPQDGERSDVVVTVAWRCAAEQDGVTVYNCGVTSLAPPKDSFVPFSQLTEDMVLNWVWENGIDKSTVEVRAERELAAKTTVALKSAPWQG